jgi:hypothetical protein
MTVFEIGVESHGASAESGFFEALNSGFDRRGGYLLNPLRSSSADVPSPQAMTVPRFGG